MIKSVSYAVPVLPAEWVSECTQCDGCGGGSSTVMMLMNDDGDDDDG